MSSTQTPKAWEDDGFFNTEDSHYYRVGYITNTASTATTIQVSAQEYSAYEYSLQMAVYSTNPVVGSQMDLTKVPTVGWTTPQYYASRSVTIAAGQTLWFAIRSGVGVPGTNTVTFFLAYGMVQLSNSSLSSVSSNSSSSSHGTASLGTFTESSGSPVSQKSGTSNESQSSPNISVQSGSSVSDVSTASSKSTNSSRSNI